MDSLDCIYMCAYVYIYACTYTNNKVKAINIGVTQEEFEEEREGWE